MKKIITLLFFVCLYQVGFSQWVNLDSVPGSRAAAAAFSIGDTGYIVSGGGWDGYYGYWDNTFKYDKATGSWTELAVYPSSSLDNGPTGFAIGDTGYVGLGVGGGYQYSTTFWKYDTRLNTWTAIAGFPGVGRNSAVAFVINGKAYVGGGLSGVYIPTNDFYAYDPATGQWSAALSPCLAKGLGVNAVGFALNGKGYVGTGGNYTNGSTTWIPQSDFWAYDPTIDQWDSVASMPCGPRMGAVAFAINGKGYVGTGVSDAQQQNYLRDFWQFDPSNGSLGKWTRIEDYAGGGRENTSAFVIGNEGYVSGGIIPYGPAPTGSGMWSYTPDGVVMGGSGGGPLDIEPKSSSVCNGQMVAFIVTGGSGQGTNLVWSPSTGLNKPTGDTVQATITSDIVYTVTLGSGCLTSSASDTITVKPSNTLIFTPSHPMACPGQNVTIKASEGSQFTWSPSTGRQSTGDSVVASLPPSADSLVYIVAGLDTSNCSVTDTITLHSGGSALAGTVTAARDTICQGTPGNLSLSGNSGGTLQWQLSTDDINFTNAGDTATKYKTDPLTQSTWYRVMVGAGNCTAISDTLQLYVPPALTAYFNEAQASANVLTFNSDSSAGNIRSYHWDFGDGNISTDKNPSHTYTKDTTYYVCLTLYDGSNCSYTFCRYSDVTDGVPTISAAGNWVIYPNPFSEQINISAKQTNSHIQSVEMYDVLGQLVINKNLGNTTNTSLQLDVSSLAKGMYYVMIRTAGADYVQKVVKQ